MGNLVSISAAGETGLNPVLVDGRRRGGLADDVASYVREQILTGRMKPGSRVDQDAISETLDVSRSPVREAIILLGAEGLLELLPRRGAIVANLTRADIVDHYELYGLVSGRAVAFAAADLEPSELESLALVHTECAPGASGELSAANRSFHRIINMAAPPRTRWLIRHLEKSIPSNFYEFADGWEATAVEHHQQILEAILAKDSEAARKAMENHLRRSGEVAAKALETQGFWEK